MKKLLNVFNTLKQKVLDLVLKLEGQEAVFAKKLKIEFDGVRLKVVLEVRENKFGDDSAAINRFRKELNGVLGWVFVLYRVNDYLLEMDFRNGVLSARERVWPLAFPVPEFENEIRIRGEWDLVFSGDMYESPFKWEGIAADSEIAGGSGSVRKVVDKVLESGLEVWVPPDEPK